MNEGTSDENRTSESPRNESQHNAGTSAGWEVRATGLDYAYGQTLALQGASLQVGAGELVAVMGASGSGKSTLLLCLAGVLRPTAGEVRLGDTTLASLKEKERSALRRSRIGVLFQFGQLVQELTAAENVALPLLLGGATRGEAMDRAQTWLNRFGVADQADSRPGQMSGGQAQRVAVARSLVTEPALLLADEPTGSLDSLASEAVMSELVAVVREIGATAVIVTHDARVAAYAERAVDVVDGAVLGSSTVTATESGARHGR